MNKASCLSLLSNAVLVWNTMAIMKIITELRAAGETILDEDRARISPLMYPHLIPNGTWHFGRCKPGDEHCVNPLPYISARVLPVPRSGRFDKEKMRHKYHRHQR